MKKTRKKLSLSRRTLRELSNPSLHTVAGGTGEPSIIVQCGGDLTDFCTDDGASKWASACNLTNCRCR